MRFDTHMLAMSVLLIAALILLLLPLYFDLGKPGVFETTTAVLVSASAAFVLGKRFGEARHG